MPLAAGTALAAPKKAPEKDSGEAGRKLPNIVLFYVDDMGYGDLAITGAIGYQTPNLDRLAREGMHFTQYYSPSPVS